jgi:thiol-disulfide isomerase/thioredoxin
MSSRHSRLSTPKEALIRRIAPAGPAANRPPHMGSAAMRPSVSAAVLIVLLPALAACDRAGDTKPPPGAQPEPAAASAPAAPAPPRRVKGFDASRAGTPAPSAAFVAPSGEPSTLAAFRGKPVLLNLWATWCAPCVAEMPALDRLATRGDGRFVVLTVSQDLEERRAVDPFFARGRFARLQPYTDAKNELPLALGAAGLPMSVLYDAGGREVWRLAGEWDWDKVDAARLAELARGAPGG